MDGLHAPVWSEYWESLSVISSGRSFINFLHSAYHGIVLFLIIFTCTAEHAGQCHLCKRSLAKTWRLNTSFKCYGTSLFHFTSLHPSYAASLCILWMENPRIWVHHYYITWMYIHCCWNLAILLLALHLVLMLKFDLVQLYMAPVTHPDRYSDSIDFWRNVYGIDSEYSLYG